MIYHLLYPLHETFSYFNVFRYITFRTIYAAITALAICFVFAPWLIRKLESLQIGQSVREDGPEAHLAKSGTPTMGGIMIIFSVVISTLLWANLTNDFVWMLIVVTVGFGLIGFFDDFNKLTQKSSKGISGRTRLILEFGIALFIGVILYLKPNFSEAITIPFFKTMLPDLGWGYILFTAFVIVGAANAVNLTDGLDGLAIGTTLIAAAAIPTSVVGTGVRVAVTTTCSSGRGSLATCAGIGRLATRDSKAAAAARDDGCWRVERAVLGACISALTGWAARAETRDRLQTAASPARDARHFHSHPSLMR